MPVVVLGTEDLTVIGPPETVAVSTDFGAKGDPGSQIYVGIGDPNEVSIGFEPVLNDIYINASPDANYSYMYQYISEPGGNVWVKVLRINPALYSNIYTTTFTSGTGSVQIPVSDIVTVTGGTLTADNFGVQHSIENSNPVASSVSSVSLASGTLTITIQASQISGTTISSLSGSIKVHLFISIIQ